VHVRVRARGGGWAKNSGKPSTVAQFRVCHRKWQWRAIGMMVGWCGQGCEGGGGARSSTRAREGAGVKKSENQAIVARFRSAFGVQEMEGGSVVSQAPSRGNLAGGSGV